MYPKNNASPERIAVGSIYLISSGAIQTTGASVRVMPQGGAAGAGGGTLDCDTTSGVWHYTPLQSETNYTSFMVLVYKASCTSASTTIVTTAESTAGKVSLGSDQSGATIGTVTTNTDMVSEPLDAAGIRTAVGLATANLDTQLADIPTVAEFNARTLVAASYFDPTADTVANVTTVGTVTNAITLPNIPTDWITAAGINTGAFTADAFAANALVAATFAASSLNGKGDWNTTTPDAAGIAAGLHATTDALVGAIPTNPMLATEDGSSFSAIPDMATATNQTTIAGYLDTEIAAIKAVTDKVDTTLVLDGAVYDFTADSLAAAPSGSGGDATEAKQDTIISALAIVDGIVDAVVLDTNELQTDWTDGGRLDNLLDTAAGSSGGDGARTVTITVDDGSTALESAKVRVTKGLSTYILTTNVSGQCTFNLDDGTWTVAITLGGYTYSGTSLIVNGDETETYSMTAVSPTPSTPGRTTGYLYTYSELGVVEEDVIITITMKTPPTTDGFAYDAKSRTSTSDGSGYVEFTNLFKSATYTLKRGTGKDYDFAIPSTAGDTVELTELLGLDA